MANPLGNISVSGDAEERTWRTTINTEGGDPAQYSFVAQREIIVRSHVDGSIIRRIREATDEFPNFKPRVVASAIEAEAVKPGVTAMIRDALDMLSGQ